MKQFKLLKNWVTCPTGLKIAQHVHLGMILLVLSLSITQHVFGQVDETNNYQKHTIDIENIDLFGEDDLTKVDANNYILDHCKEITEDRFFESLGLEKKYNFELVRERESRFNSFVTFKKYQGYYDGVKVENSSVTLKVNNQTGQIKTINSNIKAGISNPSSSFKLNQLKLNYKVLDEYPPELIITDAFSNDFMTCWVFDTNEGKDELKYYIDANTGNFVEKKTLSCAHLTATFPVYGGPHPLNDYKVGNLTHLMTPDWKIRIYEQLWPTSPAVPSEWHNGLIPNSSNTTDWESDAAPLSKGAFYSANLVAPEFSNMGVQFGVLHIAATLFENTRVLRGSDLTNAYIVIGSTASSNTLPEYYYDIVAHEFAHVFIGEFIDYTNNNTNQTLHEGTADLMAMYIEEFIQPTDWAYDNVSRDLSQRVCLTDLQNAGRHQRGLVVGHWYHSIVNGVPADDIPALGFQTGIDIVVDALNNLNNRNAGIPHMRHQTLLAAASNFGVCSDEYKAVLNAWERVCVTGPSQPCPCINYTSPVLSTNATVNSCPDMSISLNQFSVGTLPPNAEIVWSTDSDPTNGVSPIVNERVTTSGIYYAYYYHAGADCFGPASTPINVVISSCCELTNDVVINTHETYRTPKAIGGNINIVEDGILSVESILELGQNKEIRVKSRGLLVIQGRGEITACQSASFWQGVTVEAGGHLIVREGSITSAFHGIRANGGSKLNLKDLTVSGYVSTNLVAVSGIHLMDHVNLERAQNISIQGFYTGIYAQNATSYYEFDGGRMGFTMVGFNLMRSPSKISGYKIYSSADGITASWSPGTLLENNEIYASQNSAISGITNGIKASNSPSFVIKGNTIGSASNPVMQGINLQFCNSSSISEQNQITASYRGIYAALSDLTINQNEINTTPGSIGGILLYGTSKSQISNNYIDAIGARYGITTASCHDRSEIKNNDIYGADMAGLNRVAAIRSMGCTGQTIADNDIYGLVSTTGMLAHNSTGNTYDCNRVQSRHEGLGIYYNSMGQTIKGNKFGATMDLAIRSVIGIQEHHGNEFLGGRADASELSDVSTSQFLVNPTITYHNPHIKNPATGWFIYEPNEYNYYVCGGTPGPNWTPFWDDEDVVCDYYLDVINQYGYGSPQYTRMMMTMRRHDAFDHDYFIHECIGDEWPPECLDTLISIEEQILNYFNSETNSTEGLRDQVIDFSVDSSLVSSAMLTASTSIIQNTLLQKDASFKVLLSTLEMEIIDVDCDDLISQKSKEILLSYIEYLQSEDKESFDYSELINHSMLCSDDYGPFVHIARSIVANQTDEHFDQYDGCQNRNTDRRIATTVDTDLSMITFPNPSVGVVNVVFEEEINGLLSVSDLTGKILFEQEIDGQQQLELDLSLFPGLNLVKIMKQNGEIGSHKVLIIK